MYIAVKLFTNCCFTDEEHRCFTGLDWSFIMFDRRQHRCTLDRGKY